MVMGLLRAPFLVIALLALTACAPGGDLSTIDTTAIANRTYVLLGASSGFGQGVALKLAAHGANVVLAARRADLLQEVAAKARAAGGKTAGSPNHAINKEQDAFGST